MLHHILEYDHMLYPIFLRNLLDYYTNTMYMYISRKKITAEPY